MDSAFISPDDTWILWMFITAWAATSIYLEQRFTWASKISGAIIALLGAVILSNLHIIPTESPVYDVVWDYVVPLSIPLLLFQADIGEIWRKSGRVLIIFFLSSLGTFLGAVLSFLILKDHIPYLEKVTAMMTGSYTGGGVNFAAMASKFDTPDNITSATTVADNMLMAIFFLVLFAIPSLHFFRNKFSTPHIENTEAEIANSDNDGETQAAQFWKRKEMSIKDIGMSVASAFVLVAVSFKIAEWIGDILPESGDSNVFLTIIRGIFADEYLMLTTLTVITVSIFPNYFKKINGTREIGTFLIYLFFVVIGIPASLIVILKTAPLLFIFVLIIVLSNIIVTLVLAKTFSFTLEEALLVSNANLGGPTTAAAMAIAKGWQQLIVPILLVGTLGYVIGNYLGTAIYYLIAAIF